MTTGPRTVVSGATGLVGRRLVTQLLDAGGAVTALTRSLCTGAGAVDGRALLARWDGRHLEPEVLENAAAVVHLAGEPVFGGRLTAKRRQRIFASRVDSTRSIVEALARLPAERRPAVLVCASAVGYYASAGNAELSEGAAPGDGFLSEVCQAWEQAAAGVEALGVRRVSLRIGIVLSREGGALPMLALPFRFGLGGRLGDGRQWVPWIDRDDLVALAIVALTDERYRGALNAVAPNPVTNAELSRAVARTLRRPAFLPVPGFAIRAALGGLADELLGSRRVVPERALDLGFHFAVTRIEDALARELGEA